MFEMFQHLGDSRVTNYMLSVINSTALRATWSGPGFSDVTSYDIRVVLEMDNTEVASYSITMNIGNSPNYEDQELIISGLSPFTSYVVTVTALINGDPLSPNSQMTFTPIVGNI